MQNISFNLNHHNNNSKGGGCYYRNFANKETEVELSNFIAQIEWLWALRSQEITYFLSRDILPTGSLF